MTWLHIAGVLLSSDLLLPRKGDIVAIMLKATSRSFFKTLKKLKTYREVRTVRLMFLSREVRHLTYAIEEIQQTLRTFCPGLRGVMGQQNHQVSNIIA